MIALSGGLFEEGNRLLEQGEFQRSLSPYQRALAEYRKVKDLAGEALTLTNLGIAYYRLSQYQKALEVSSAAVPLHEQMLERARSRWLPMAQVMVY